MDLDCLVRGKLDELFDYANNPYGVALAEDPRPEKIRVKVKLGILKPGQKHFNCGVMPYLHDSELIRKWALSTIEKQGYYLGNQVFFLELLNELGIDLPTIPKKYNWLVPGSGIGEEAVVLHFIEEAKEMGLGLVEDFNKTKKSL
jgi:hypothetical protein